MRVQEISGKDVHNMKARSLSVTLLPHKTRSKLSRSGQANPGFEGGQGGPGRPGLSRGGPGGFQKGPGASKTRKKKKLG